MLLILFEGFADILLFAGFFVSRSHCLAFAWEIDAGMEIERFDVGIPFYLGNSL